jgi:hypothetical protein
MMQPPFWIVQAHGIHLSKLIYLSKGEYNFLEHLRDIFIERIPECPEATRIPRQREAKRQSKRLTEEPTSVVSYAVYEPSHIGNVFNSEYWNWRRYKAYYRYVYGEEGMEKRYREVEEFMKG